MYTITWFFAVALIMNTEQYWILLWRKTSTVNTIDTRKQWSISRSLFYQNCNFSWRLYSVVWWLKDGCCKRSCCWVIQSETTTEMKPERLFAVDLCFNHHDHKSDVSCALLVQQHAAKQVIWGSNVSRVHPENVSIMGEDLPYNHEQFTGSLFSEQYMLVQQITCIS